MLAVLHARDDAYGMNVRREIEGRTDREVAIGAVYATLDRLCADGYVSVHAEQAGNRPTRRVYSITPAGLTELKSRRDELAGVENDISASVRRLADNLRQDIRVNMRGLRADLAATAEAARTSARSAGSAGSAGSPGYSPEGERRLKEAEMLVQADLTGRTLAQRVVALAFDRRGRGRMSAAARVLARPAAARIARVPVSLARLVSE